jgi:hypothetical protein
VATVLLAALTVALALSGRRAALAAADASSVAQRQLQESVRPVLVPGPPRPDPDDERRTLVSVRNIGVGPALNLYGRAQRRGQPAEVLGRFPAAKVAGESADGSADLSFAAAAVTARAITRLELQFTDVSGQHYSAEAGWDQRAGAFGHLTIREREGLKLERIPPPAAWRRIASRLGRRPA